MVRDLPPGVNEDATDLSSSVCEISVPRRTTPKHRSTAGSPVPSTGNGPARHRAVRTPVSAEGRTDGLRRQLGRTLAFTGVAVAATGVAVAGGIATTQAPATATASLAGDLVATNTPDASVLEDLQERGDDVTASRSDRRTSVDMTKVELLSSEAESGGQVTRDEDLGGGDPRSIAQALLPEFGFSSDQFSCLDSLWTKESGWNVYADNPTSSAYGIPQALPGSKMSSAGADWATNPETQIRWGLGYIADRYGSPCAAWSHSQANNWY